MKSVIYLIALEKVFNNAIFENQVRKLLVGLKRVRGDGLKLTLLVLLPWIEITRRGPYSNFRLHRDELERLKRELADDGIELVVSRTLFPSAFFQMKIVGLCCFSLLTLPVVWYHLLSRRAGLIHCRYYYASFVALLASRLSLHRVKVIFDVRTLLPEQGLVNLIWRRENASFKFWKRVEKWMVACADRVICVSSPMTELIVNEHPGAAVETIPNFVDLEHFRQDGAHGKIRRRELRIENRTVLLYSGTLGGRYPAGRMAECVKLFCQAIGPESFFLVLTSSDEKRLEPLAMQLEANGLCRDKDWKTLDVGAGDVAGYLNAADWSLLVLDDFLTSETFLPIKFAEYLAAGLPVLTHPQNSGIIDILGKYRIGAVLDGAVATAVLGENLRRDKDLMRENCIATAHAEFSLKQFIERYSKIYAELTEDGDNDSVGLA